ncbi:hypothetical protein NL676_017489 [Syzygium grande]|nr:hypothetical protein NL676_017489 [Syzygium grande]
MYSSSGKSFLQASLCGEVHPRAIDLRKMVNYNGFPSFSASGARPSLRQALGSGSPSFMTRTQASSTWKTSLDGLRNHHPKGNLLLLGAARPQHCSRRLPSRAHRHRSRLAFDILDIRRLFQVIGRQSCP